MPVCTKIRGFTRTYQLHVAERLDLGGVRIQPRTNRASSVSGRLFYWLLFSLASGVSPRLYEGWLSISEGINIVLYARKRSEVQSFILSYVVVVYLRYVVVWRCCNCKCKCNLGNPTIGLEPRDHDVTYVSSRSSFYYSNSNLSIQEWCFAFLPGSCVSFVLLSVI